MPFIIRKVRNKNCWQVKNKDTGFVHAKCTTKEKAEAQIRLLNMVTYGKNKKKK
jgi:hypothetical protein